MLRSRSLILAVLLAGPEAAHAQTALAPLSSISSASAGAYGLTADDLTEMNQAAAELGRTRPATFELGASAGLVVRRGLDGGLTVLKGPTDKPEDILIEPEAMMAFRGLRKSALVELLTPKARAWSLLDRIDPFSQTVGPSSTNFNPKTLPPAWRERALKVGWNGGANPLDDPCAVNRKSFFESVEGRTSGASGGLAGSDSEETRQRLIGDAKAFDTACLVKVTDYRTSPLSGLAVIAAGEGAFCMALHLGGTRFLTARHCFYDPKTGEAVEGAVISMADKSALSIPFRPAAHQPLNVGSPTSARADLLVLEAEGLPAAVAARSGPELLPSDQLAGVMISEAKVVGYYSLADPERAIPSPGGVSLAPEWSQALRGTRVNGESYCRVWDYTPPRADGAACLQHSCQTLKGFSGTPVFVLRDDKHWVVAGVHVNNSDDASGQDCADFKGRPKFGLMRSEGGLAAAIPRDLTARQTASITP